MKSPPGLRRSVGRTVWGVQSDVDVHALYADPLNLDNQLRLRAGRFKYEGRSLRAAAEEKRRAWTLGDLLRRWQSGSGPLVCASATLHLRGASLGGSP